MRNLTRLLAAMFCLLTASAQTSTTVQRVFTNWNIGGVLSGPSAPSVFHTRYPLTVTYVNTYHFHEGHGSPAGTIALRHTDGTVYGPWRTTGVLSSGAPDGTWEARPNQVIKPGTYTVVDSDPATWSQNPESRGQGFCEVQGAIYMLPTGGNY